MSATSPSSKEFKYIRLINKHSHEGVCPCKQAPLVCEGVVFACLKYNNKPPVWAALFYSLCVWWVDSLTWSWVKSWTKVRWDIKRHTERVVQMHKRKVTQASNSFYFSNTGSGSAWGGVLHLPGPIRMSGNRSGSRRGRGRREGWTEHARR